VPRDGKTQSVNGISSRQSRRRWPLWRSLLAVSTAFAVGCIPAARLAAMAASPRQKDRLALMNPGTSSVHSVMGRKAAVTVFTGDAVKGLAPPLLGRAAGADAVIVDALMLAPLAGHIAVGGGRGVATLCGSVLAGDPAGFFIVLPVWVIPSVKRDHARGVLAACLLFPLVRLLRGRSKTSVMMGALVPLFLIYGRLRGPGWAGTRWTSDLVWSRITCDADSASKVREA